ncbi:MAG TPA: S-methyl-5-thioribose-1-phosphate isomerase [Thermoanaerobaculia bacterium]|nr:S-methyl-5-thioribose-1-phosphate isomerase [Thermoanaerobaculia bacterium]
MSTDNSEPFSPLRWEGGTLALFDQTRLPAVEEWLTCRHPEQVADAIRRLAVRGAPAIGVAAAYGLALGFALPLADESPAGLARRFDEVAELLAATRPTAVNLRWAIERGRATFAETLDRAEGDGAAGREVVYGALLFWARALHAADIATNQAIGEHGAGLFAPGERVLTHCNTGSLATAGYGTALGVIHSSWRQGKVTQVWVDETRPLLQGARLTAWELARLGIPFRVLPDAAAGALLSRGDVDRIVVGADRIAANGDVANKIGTYPLAVLAQRHRVPFYVAAPLSTIDPATASGADIPIEERAAAEVTELAGVAVAPDGAAALNLAFDVTPAELVTAIVTEAGVLHPPYGESIARALAEGSR